MESKVLTKFPTMFNHFVASHPKGDVLQTTYWGDLKATTGWEYFPLVILKDNQIRASALILSRKLPYPGARLFYSPRGPLYSDTNSLEALLQAGKRLATEKGAIFWKMDPPIPCGEEDWSRVANKYLTKVETGPDFDSVQPKFVMALDIRPSLDDLLQAMKSKTRYNIRYSKRKRVKVVRSQNKEDLELFYPLLLETAKRDKFTVRSFDYFGNLWDCLVANRLAQLFLAFHEGQLLAGTIAFKLGKRVWYIYGASSNHKRNLQPTYGIQWEMIRWAKASGCHIYDFRGVSGDLDPDNPLYGLYRFKEGFGAKLLEYTGEYDLVVSPTKYRLWNMALPLYQRYKNRK